jgi:hypothetical protein
MTTFYFPVVVLESQFLSVLRSRDLQLGRSGTPAVSAFKPDFSMV